MDAIAVEGLFRGYTVLISNKIKTAIQNGSMVRQMFEEGIRLKIKYGKEAVFDYSLGNPDLSPPASFKEALIEAAKDDRPGIHGYMPNAGLPDVLSAVAKYLSEDNWDELNQIFYNTTVVMTVGAAGGLNAVLKSILDPGDEVLVLAPFFMEYSYYIDNHAGVIKVVQTDDAFRPVPEKIREAIGEKTKALLINTPNNPTGTVYSRRELAAIGEVLGQASAKYKRDLVLISDEPYKKIVFKGKKAPSVFACYPNTVVVTSFSKDLSIPGERLGYVAMNPMMKDVDSLSTAVTLSNRILGSVNAPAIIQRAVQGLIADQADLWVYEERSTFLATALMGRGYELKEPEGAFYLFPKSPIPDDVVFTSLLREENILAVPGEGFGRPGYFRLSLCLDMQMIQKSLEGFTRALEKARNLTRQEK
jgi:aspartate aminotransferase